METVKRDGFIVAGLKIEVSNKEAMETGCIWKAWEELFSSGILESLKNKVWVELYGVYTDYEENFLDDVDNKKYSLIIWAKVSSKDDLPGGVSYVEIPELSYKKFEARGKMPEVVYQTWWNIWGAGLDRKFDFDFEEYKVMWDNAEVDIYISV